MSDTILVYVHGSGPQGYKSGDDLKVQYDLALFEGPGPSVAPTWWQVFWCVKKPAAEVALDALIEELASNAAEPETAADELLAAIRAARPPQPPVDAAAESTEVARTEEARSMIRDLYAAAAAGPPTEMPEPIFKFLAGHAAKDVVPYLYDGWACRMREPVKAALRLLDKDRPLVLVVHSLGSILAYDVITDPEFKDRDLRLFLTAGTPLGIDNVVEKVRDWQGPGPLPELAVAWHNFHDPRDRVAKFGESLEGKYFKEPPLTEKLNVDNERDGHHDLVGYLVDPDLRVAARKAVGFGLGARR
jgi:hypothetical protein